MLSSLHYSYFVVAVAAQRKTTICMPRLWRSNLTLTSPHKVCLQFSFSCHYRKDDTRRLLSSSALFLGFPSPSSSRPFLPPGAAPPSSSAQSSYYSNAPLLQSGNASVGGNSISERPVPAYGAPSTYSASNAGHGTYSANGHGDSIADLKRQQHEVVLSYDPNAQPQLRQHTDSGVRAVDPTLAVDLPPVYTAE